MEHDTTADICSRLYHRTRFGRLYLGDALPTLRDRVKAGSIDLIVTSPPFGLVRKKDYGNVNADEYVEWFRPFGQQFKRVLKPNGSLVIDIGGAWIPGQPTRSLYHYELLIMLCKELGFHLAQEFFWWNPCKIPGPAAWVTVRRIRVKDAVNCVWWLSPTPWPKASNRRVLTPYSDAMRDFLKNGYHAKRSAHRKLRPSGHYNSEKFLVDNGAAIPPNLIALPNSVSNSAYLRYCKEHDLTVHPARYPAELPEFFIRMLTDRGDRVLDPFAGSCVTGEVAERMARKWMCIELLEEYLEGAIARFEQSALFPIQSRKSIEYKLAHPANLWSEAAEEPLSKDGGKRRPRTEKFRGGKQAGHQRKRPPPGPGEGKRACSSLSDEDLLVLLRGGK